MKTKNGLKINFTRRSCRDIHDILFSIFWKNPDLVPVAKNFLDHIREWSRTESPYQACEWENYCVRNALSQSSYHNMLKRLRKAGLIEKKYNKYRKAHELYLSDSFSVFLRDMGAVWDNYIRK